ncbi:hypothetical protein V6N11_008173 [Hibiscus sabdariffa]|uniref:Heparanase-like protein 1 n=1 Tax=Hibiscus sabdariffa TaxID=183260 RepID=A0ABR2Q0G8_9ROSI
MPVSSLFSFGVNLIHRGGRARPLQSIYRMELRFGLFLSVALIPVIFAQDISHGSIVVDGTMTVAQTDDNFVCATIDWWPHDKCDYGQCPWHYTSVTNLNLSHPFLAKAVQAFNNLRIRVGGSLQDQVQYDVGNLKSPCHPFEKMKDGLFGFSKGCLHMERWDELNRFFKETGVMVTFGLNALHGRHKVKRSLWGGDWDSSNAQEFLKYTISKGYHIDSWEFGNELSGHGSRVLDVMSHHMYNLGAGVDPKLISKILNPDHLNKASYTFGNLTHVIRRHGPWSSAWVGESGGAYNSGGAHVSNTFVNSFWQTLIGGNYGLLNATTFVPNPDYYSALLWHRLMGKVVLSVESDASPFLRSYAHCSKGRAGVTLLVINLSNQTNFVMNVQNSINLKLAVNEQNMNQGGFTHTLKKTFSWVGTKASNEALFREEYHLTPKDGYLQSRTMVLNGIPLEFTDAGNIPSLDPVHVNLKSPISISPLSIAFIVFPNFKAPACG